MRIGIDARNLVPKLTGIGRYVLEMSRQLGRMGNSLILYLPEPPHQKLPEIPSSELRISNFVGAARRAIWSMTTLPKAANEDNLDLFWGPAHRLPHGLDRRLPRIVTIHDLVWRKASHSMRWQTWIGEQLFMRSSLAQADIIMAVSIATAVDVVSFCPVAKHKTHVVYPGLTEFPTPKKYSNAPSRDVLTQRYALFVGTLEPRKNLRALLLAFGSLPASIRNELNLIIAGGQGWRTSDLDALIDREGLRQTVTLTGYVSESDLAQLYASADFLVMPSLYEGFGLPIIEAQSFGVPVITSNRASMPEVAGKGAILVDPESIGDLTNAIMKLHLDERIRRRLSEEAKLNAGRFSWGKACTELLALAETAIEARRII